MNMHFVFPPRSICLCLCPNKKQHNKKQETKKKEKTKSGGEREGWVGNMKSRPARPRSLPQRWWRPSGGPPSWPANVPGVGRSCLGVDRPQQGPWLACMMLPGRPNQQRARGTRSGPRPSLACSPARSASSCAWSDRCPSHGAAGCARDVVPACLAPSNARRNGPCRGIPRAGADGPSLSGGARHTLHTASGPDGSRDLQRLRDGRRACLPGRARHGQQHARRLMSLRSVAHARVRRRATRRLSPTISRASSISLPCPTPSETLPSMAARKLQGTLSLLYPCARLSSDPLPPLPQPRSTAP